MNMRSLALKSLGIHASLIKCQVLIRGMYLAMFGHDSNPSSIFSLVTSLGEFLSSLLCLPQQNITNIASSPKLRPSSLHASPVVSMLGQASTVVHDPPQRQDDDTELSDVLGRVFGSDYNGDPLELILNERLDEKYSQLMDGTIHIDGLSVSRTKV